MQVALSTHLFLYQCFNEDLLHTIKSNGFSNIEIWGMRPHFDYYQADYVAKLANSIKKLGMKVVAVHAPFYAHVEQAKAGQWLSLADLDLNIRKATQSEILALLKVLPALDCSLLVVHPGGLEDQPEHNLRENLKDGLRVLLAYCEPVGIKIALENINSELGSPRMVFQLVEEFASPNLGMCLDLGHAYLNGELFPTLETVIGKLIHIHASDNDGQRDLHQIPFAGNIDWGKVFYVLLGLNYRGYVSWELRHTENPSNILPKIYANSGKIFPFSQKNI